MLAYGDGSKPWYLVNPKIAGKWMFIPLRMVLIGIDPYPYGIFIALLPGPPRSTHHFLRHRAELTPSQPATRSAAGNSDSVSPD